MKVRLQILLLLSFLLMAKVELFGQPGLEKLVTVEGNSLTMEQFVVILEKQTGLRFYYDATATDSVRITINVQSQKLSSVLETALKGKDLYFTIDDRQHLFISRNRTLNTFLPADFFTKSARAVTTGPVRDTIASVRNISGAITEMKTDDRVYEIGEELSRPGENSVIIAGYITDSKTGEPIAGASVSVEAIKTGAVTDQYGYFSLKLPKGRNTVLVQGIGIRSVKRNLQLVGDGKVSIEVDKQLMVLRNVLISSQKINNIRSAQLGVQKMEIKTIRQIPVVFGEADILKAMLTLPGVKTVGEASTGLNVRGGSVDQNLILFNDATIFNPSHFFGMFSAFNPEIVKEVELLKSSIPARYGGRLSSVVNIVSREGSKKKFSGVAGIGALTSRVLIEGPLVKDKTSFILAGRTTYANWLLNLLPDQYKKSRASFYDVNLNINHTINAKNDIYLTGYLSKDRFNLNNDTTFGYQNQSLSIKWKHIFNNQLTGIFTTGIDQYDYDISSNVAPYVGYKLDFSIQQAYFKSVFNYFLDNRHSIDFGFSSLRYKLNPGSYQPYSEASVVKPERIPDEQALESAIYISDRFNINNKLTIDGGIRFSLYNYLGPGHVNYYADGLPKTSDNIIDSAYFGNGKFIKTYGAPEIRLSFRYAFSDSFSLKAGYTTQRQYIHLLSNTSAMAPTDIWKLSDPNIRPQSGDQISMGLYRNFKSNTIETSVEVYYKRIKNYLDFLSGAELVMNPAIETAVAPTRGKAYGVELFVKKLTGKLNGWISYTWSRILLKMDDANTGEIINNGNYYPANYDKPHDVTLIANYKVNNRFSFSLNSTYSTGRPFTLPIGRFYFNNSPRTLYGDRNGYRIPDYFRADFSMNIEGNHKVNQRTHQSWTIGVYNLTGRRNAYSVYYVTENNSINGYKLSIFGSAIPYINFNIRF